MRDLIVNGTALSNEDRIKASELGMTEEKYIEKYPDAPGPVLGEDGNMSQENYALARKAWIDQSLDPKDFEKEFGGYKNPNYKYIDDKQSASSRKTLSPEEKAEAQALGYTDEEYILAYK